MEREVGQSMNRMNFQLIETFEAFFKDKSLTALSEFESNIEINQFQSVKGDITDQSIADFNSILTNTSLGDPLNFWEIVNLFSLINHINPISLVIQTIKHAFFQDQFDHIRLLMTHLTDIHDLIILIIANSIPTEDIQQQQQEKDHKLLKYLKKNIVRKEDEEKGELYNMYIYFEWEVDLHKPEASEYLMQRFR